jgi:hypothetical protein
MAGEFSMARRPRKKPPTEAALERFHRQRNVMHKLSMNLRCDDPLVADLSPEQIDAVHEFFHTLLAAGYKLYQLVPPYYADPIIEAKFRKIFPCD